MSRKSELDPKFQLLRLLLTPQSQVGSGLAKGVGGVARVVGEVLLGHVLNVQSVTGALTFHEPGEKSVQGDRFIL